MQTVSTINKLELIGWTGQDPKLIYSSKGTPIATLHVATKRLTHTNEEVTDWHQVTIFGKQAEHCHQYLQKGSRVRVEGHIRPTQWTDNDDQTHYGVDIIAETVMFLNT